MLNVSKFYRRGHRHLATQVTGLASLVALVLMGLPAQASVTLTRAQVEALRNRVEFIPRGQQARAARMSDFLAVGDALRTAASSRADLRFNDGSLARVGERATFRFVPNTRNFRLTNGTVLLLIPPGQGRTNIQTPSAVTGIQGSAVVVRYVPESDLTLVMALTNNPAGPMTITTGNCDGGADCGSTEYALYGGQMALIQNNQVQVLEFDLPTFYQTSPLVEGLELDNPNAESPLGAALEPVREETLEALEEQSLFSEDSVMLNPVAIGLDGAGQVASEQPWLLSPAGAGISPLSPLSGVLTPGNSLVTSIPPQDVALPPRASGGIPNPALPPTVSGQAPTPNPTPVQPILGPGIGETPAEPPVTGPAPTPNPTPVQPILGPGIGETPAEPPVTGPVRPSEPILNQPPGGGNNPGNGGGVGGGNGPGNAEPPPFNGGVPADPPAEPPPFVPPDK